MKIAVCIKQVVTRDVAGARRRGADLDPRSATPASRLNEPDAYALEEALRLKEKHGGEVIVVSAGPARVTQVLREALARGADRAIHVHGDALARADASVVGEALAAALKDERRRSRAHRPAVRRSGLRPGRRRPGRGLGLSHATISWTCRSTAAALRVKRELEGGWFQWVAMPLPALLTIQSGINQLRYATLKGIMAAKKKEIRVVAAPAGRRRAADRRSLASRRSRNRRG